MPEPAACPSSLTSKRSFLWKLAAGCLLINAFVAGMAVWMVLESEMRHRERVRITAENLTQVLVEDLSGSFAKIDFALKGVCDEIDRQRASGGIDPPSLNGFITRSKQRLPELDSLRVADSSGVIRYGVGVDPASRISIADRDYFLRLREDPGAGLVFSRPVLGLISGKWVVVLGRRISGPNGTFLGAVYAPIEMDYFTRLFSRLDVGPRGVISMWSTAGVAMARYPLPPGGNIGGITTISSQLRAFIESGRNSGSYTTVSPIDNIERIFYLRKFAAYPFYVSVGQSFDDFLAAWREEAGVAAGVFALFAAMTLAGAWAILRSWSRREEAVLALERARDQLEARVAERTAELRAMVKELSIARDEAESASRMKIDFLANITHELKTPLNPILAFADLGLASDPDPEMREYLSHVRQAAGHLHAMIDSLIELSELEVYVPEHAPVSPRSVLEIVGRDLTPEASGKGLELLIDAAADAPQAIVTDLKLLRLALTCIGQNAVKFTGAGRVRLSYGADESPGLVFFCVEDTGIGIAPDKIAAIAAGFSQGDSPMTKKHRGLGLGMAMAHKALELLGARLEVTSEPGKGSLFRICLPEGTAQAGEAA